MFCRGGFKIDRQRVVVYLALYLLKYSFLKGGGFKVLTLSFKDSQLRVPVPNHLSYSAY